MNIANFNDRAQEVHELNAKWWVDLETGERLDRNKGEMLMLVVTELAEAAEGERKGLMDDHIPTRPMAEVELADALIRILDFAGGLGYKFEDDLNLAISAIYEDLLTFDQIVEKYNVGKNKLSDLFDISTQLTYLNAAISGNIEEGVTEYLSSFVFSLYAYALMFGYDIEGAYYEKLEYNKTRKDHTIEARKAPGGKKV